MNSQQKLILTYQKQEFPGLPPGHFEHGLNKIQIIATLASTLLSRIKVIDIKSIRAYGSLRNK
jgi:hypothetical protein